MPQRRPVWVYHFTRVEHLDSISRVGLVSDNEAKARGLILTEIGNNRIKGRRELRQVPVAPGGVVADYVPFYFAPRSPMMYAIHRGNVPTYTEGCDRIVYLVSSVERLQEEGCALVVTDRNAVLELAAFGDSGHDLDNLIDWDLMAARMWNNTEEDPDRKERRQAECLAHMWVPWSAVLGIVTKNASVLEEASSALPNSPVPKMVVRPDWYF